VRGPDFTVGCLVRCRHTGATTVRAEPDDVQRDGIGKLLFFFRKFQSNRNDTKEIRGPKLICCT
jgi:hypothetical protein